MPSFGCYRRTGFAVQDLTEKGPTVCLDFSKLNYKYLICVTEEGLPGGRSLGEGALGLGRRARGEGTIHRRRDGIFEGKVSLGSVDGKRLRKTVYGQSKREVADALRDLSLRFEGADSSVALADYLNEWLKAGRDNRGWAPNTYRLRESLVRNHLNPYLGAKRLKDVDISDVKMLLRRWNESKTASSIRAKAFKTLSGALNVAYREQVIYRNPCVFVDAPKHRRKKMHLITVEQALKLMSQVEPTWLQTFLVVAIMTALRQGELFALHWEHIDMKRATIEVAFTVVDDFSGFPTLSPTKTDASERKIALPLRALAALDVHRSVQRANGYHGPLVFPDGQGGLLRKSNFIRRSFKPALKRLSLPDVTFHSMRHLSNSVAIQEGANALEIASRNGQIDTRMVFDVYGHLLKAADRTVSRAMDAAFGEPSTADFAANGRRMVVDSSLPNKSKTRKPLQAAGQSGGDVRIRTADPLHAKQVLYQLSYTPTRH